MSYNACDYYAHSTISGWRFSLQTYRFISDNSPFFKAVYDKDIPRVQEMLLSREAFVTDRLAGYLSLKGTYFIRGATALHVRYVFSDLFKATEANLN
jgi:hypothetical protein